MPKTLSKTLRQPVNPAVLARKPQQQRAKDRVQAVLQAAEDLLVDSGVPGFSIPTLAERLGYPRATIYKFFPTPYALFNELAERHLSALEQHLGAYSRDLAAARSWQEAIGSMVHAAADYYGRHPAAAVVLLTGPVSDSSFRALEYTISRLGSVARELLDAHEIRVPAGPPDIAALAVEFGTASFRMSYFLNGRITPEYTEAAVDAMISFLDRRLHGSATPAAAARKRR